MLVISYEYTLFFSSQDNNTASWFYIVWPYDTIYWKRRNQRLRVQFTQWNARESSSFMSVSSISDLFRRPPKTNIKKNKNKKKFKNKFKIF
jgi:hypothetical protein